MIDMKIIPLLQIENLLFQNRSDPRQFKCDLSGYAGGKPPAHKDAGQKRFPVYGAEGHKVTSGL